MVMFRYKLSKRPEDMPMYALCQGAEPCPSHLVQWEEAELGPEGSAKPTTMGFHHSGYPSKRNG